MLHVVKDANALRGYNWAQFVLDSLASGIHRYRALNLTYMSGCVFFLMILFFEHVNNQVMSYFQFILSGLASNFGLMKEVRRRMRKYKSNGEYSKRESRVALESRFVPHEKETTTSKGRSIGARELSIERELDRVKIDVQELKDQLKENTSAVLEMTRVFKQLVDRLELPLTDNMEKKVKKVKKNEFRENEGERQDVKVWMVMNVNEFQEGCGKSKGKKNESQKIDIEGPYHGWSPFFLRMFAKLRVKMLL